MNLTNKETNRYQTCNVSKYLLEEQHLDQYNYSDSNINETLLLEATLLDSKKDQGYLSQPLLGLREDSCSISNEKSLVFDLCGQLSMSSQGSTPSDPYSHKQIKDLYNICGSLVQTLSRLQNKVEMIEGKEPRPRQQNRDSRNSLEQQVQSRLTYASLQSSKVCKCDSQVPPKDLLCSLLQVLQSKSKPSPCSQENQELRKQVVRLQIANQELKKWSKRTQVENHRLRELLKQCQKFSKKLASQKESQGHNLTHEKQFRTNLTREHSQKILSQRQPGSFQPDPHSEQNSFKTRQLGFSSENYFDSQKENIKLDSGLRLRGSPFDIHTSKVHSHTHSPVPRKTGTRTSFERQIILDPQRKREPQSNIKIVSFQQCRGHEGACNSPFVRKGGVEVLRPLAENHSKSFMDLRVMKSKQF